jgi:WD40 repeat protein
MFRRAIRLVPVVFAAALAGLLCGCGDDKGSTSPAVEAPSAASAGQGAVPASAKASKSAPPLEPAHYLVGHTDGVHSVAFSPDGRLLATASHDGTARLWDIASGTQVKLLEGHTGAVYSVAFSPDGHSVATSGADGLVLVWDVGTGDLLSMLQGHQFGVSTVSFTPDGNVVSGGQDTTIRRWDVSEEKERWRVRADPLGVLCAAVAPDGSLLATGSGSAYVVVWDLAEGRPVWRERVPRNDAQENELRARQGQPPSYGADPDAKGGDDSGRPPAAVGGVAFSPDGSKLFTRTHYGAIQEWEAKSGRNIRHLEPFDCAMAMALTRDGKWIFIADNGGARVWKLQENPMELVAALAVYSVNDTHAVAFSPDGRFAALGRGGAWREGRVWRPSDDNRVAVWDLGGLIHPDGPSTTPAPGPTNAP